MNAHFFDISSLIRVDSKVWLVSKTNPNTPLIKISESDFNLMKKGLWKKSGVKLKIGNNDFYIKPDLFEKIKLKCKNTNTDISSIAFSMQEFMNPEIIEKLDFKIVEDHLVYLKNTNDDIYLICSNNTKENYSFQLKKLEDYLLKIGLKFKNFYFISETFYNRDSDKISHKKIRLLLQHLIGLKTDDNKFTDKEITQYDEVYFYDDENNSIKLCKNSNQLLKFLYENTDPNLKEKVKSIVNEKKLTLHCNEVTFNKVNPYIKTDVILSIDRVIKTFEGFIFRF